MKKSQRLFLFRVFAVLSSIYGMFSVCIAQNGDSLQAHFTVFRCDSLIQANVANPDFCVMDVRTLPEYFPDHLEEAVNRNYYDPGFDSLINLLPRHKMYLVYCLAGGRSASTYNLMVSMGFPNVVNMLGGITAWKNAGFPTTPDFAPRQMAVSDTIVPDDTVYIGMTDTILLTLTNRANDTLRFTSITSLEGTEFSTNFDTTTTLEGPFDYSFFIFYSPTDTLTDSLAFRIESNGGPVQFHITRTGQMPAVGEEEFRTSNPGFRIFSFPNPFSSSTTIEFELDHPALVEITIINSFGQEIDRYMVSALGGLNKLVWHAGGRPSGVYVCRIMTGDRHAIRKLQLVK